MLLKKCLVMILLIINLVSCHKDKSKDAILMAEREAPIGWNHLRIYKDSTFEFEYTSFPNSKFHKGEISILEDTLNFYYINSIPAFGSKAIIDGDKLIYTEGSHNEHLEIWLDSISK